MDKRNPHWMEQQIYRRRLQTIPVNNTAMISIAAPIVKHLKLSTHDTMIEMVDNEGRIILTKASDRESERDGDGWV